MYTLLSVSPEPHHTRPSSVFFLHSLLPEDKCKKLDCTSHVYHFSTVDDHLAAQPHAVMWPVHYATKDSCITMIWSFLKTNGYSCCQLANWVNFHIGALFSDLHQMSYRLVMFKLLTAKLCSCFSESHEWFADKHTAHGCASDFIEQKHYGKTTR